MGELADLLSKGSPDDPADTGDGGGGDDPDAMGQTCLKAAFAAMKSGDWGEAWEQFKSAQQYADSDAPTGPVGGDGDAEDTAKGKPGMVIAIGHKR